MALPELLVGVVIFSIFIVLLYPAVQLSSDTYSLNLSLNQFMNKMDAAMKRIEYLTENNGGIDDWTTPDGSGKVSIIQVSDYWYALDGGSLVRSSNKNLNNTKYLIKYDKTLKNRFEIKKFDFYLYDGNGNIITDEVTEPVYIRMDVEADNFSVEENKNRQIKLKFSNGFSI
jgi:type II secretory pathway pseudopilin PulG